MKNIYHHTLRLLTAPEKRRFYLLIFLELLVTLLDLVFLALLLLVVAHYTETLKAGVLPSWFEAFIAIHPLLLIGSFLLLFAVKNLLGMLVYRKLFRYLYSVATRLSEKMLGQYFSGSYEDYVHTDSSVLIRRVSQQPVEFSHHVLRGLQQVISNSILVALSTLAILLFDVYLFGMLFLMLLPAIALLVFYAKSRLTHIRRTIRTYREKTTQHLKEALSGFIEANLYQRKEFFISRYRAFQEKYNEHLAWQQVMLGLPPRFMEVFAVLGLFLLIVINTYILQSESLLLLIGAFMAAAYKIIPGVVKILNHLQQVRIYSYGIEELETARASETEKVEQTTESIKSIELENLRFAYGERSLFSGLSFRLSAGELMGLSAPSGQGKTTLVHLLLGFLEPQSGNIFFNEHSTTAALRRTYWPRISYDRQQSFLIHDSIQHNIALSEDPDMKELWRAVAETGLNSFVSGAEKGLDTVITEDGKNISGGQRQRLMMARALYRDADLYIFDEPFSELDNDSAVEMLDQLKSLAARGKMVLLITHDDRALQACSKIIRLYER